MSQPRPIPLRPINELLTIFLLEIERKGVIVAGLCLEIHYLPRGILNFDERLAILDFITRYRPNKIPGKPFSWEPGNYYDRVKWLRESIILYSDFTSREYNISVSSPEHGVLGAELHSKLIEE